MIEENEIRVNAEIAAALTQDDSRLGDVWRGKAAGKSDSEIASDLGVRTSKFVWNQQRIARAIATGDMPSAPSMIRSALSATRAFLSRHGDILSDGAQKSLMNRIQRLEALSENEEAVQLEDKLVRESAVATLNLNIPGIYVYTLPHYYRHPVLPADGDLLTARTLMKVGMAENDVIKRFRKQERNTALPEDPWLLRIYTCISDVYQTEQAIHRLLRAADHRQSAGRSAGTEWFITSLRFLDEVAKQKQMEAVYRIDDATTDGEP